MPITERTKRLKARCRWKHTSAGEFVDETVRTGIERARLITESHKNTVGEPRVIRRARGLANILNNITIIIQEDELVVGDHIEHPEAIPLYPELSYFVTLDLVQSKYCPDEVKEEAMEICNYWEPYTLQRKGEAYYTEEELERAYQFSTVEGPAFVTGFNSIVPPYETVLEDGLQKRIELIQAKRLKLEEIGKLHFDTVDFNRYPCLKYAYDAGITGHSMPSILNAANEAAVQLFLEEKISFLEIEKIIYEALKNHNVIKNPDLETILLLDQNTKESILSKYSKGE